jgi:hypothetical protein
VEAKDTRPEQNYEREQTLAGSMGEIKRRKSDEGMQCSAVGIDDGGSFAGGNAGAGAGARR